MKTSEIEQSGIHLGTHGEKYGNWMSAPVFYMVGGLLALAVALAVLFFTVFRITVLGVIFTAAAAVLLALLFLDHMDPAAVRFRRGRHDGRGASGRAFPSGL